MNIAVFASGNGSNFEAIVRAVRKGRLKAAIRILVVDQKNAFARTRAKKLGIPAVFVDPGRFKTPLAFDKELLRIMRAERIGLILLAGYMRMLTPYFVRRYKNRIINIHPALLPAFKGTHAIERAFSYGCQTTGVSVHFVDEKMDHGPIILQEAVAINDSMSLAQLEAKIHKLEHALYPKALARIVKKQLRIKGRRVQRRKK